MGVNWLKQVLGKEWHIEKAGGLTGEAFIAENNRNRLFLKRNSSPFLAVLSAEGIVPKLVWTKRLENGDVITAQEWLDGRELMPIEMQHKQVAALLNKIHNSSELLHMLMRMGRRPITPEDRYLQVKEELRQRGIIDSYPEVQEAIANLEHLLPVTRDQEQVVCHCDLNHNNLLLTNEGQLYLVDWENAMIADPAMDIGTILKWYIPPEDWKKWLQEYGISNDQLLFERMYWYLLLDALYFLNWHLQREEVEKARLRLDDLLLLNRDAADTIRDWFAE
ncbi:phosphotransferase family protein [Virgibacillus siamensis]|uniref:phosphotransferase family protein n=1 Tax=Virgibacillus siamensis TaxID=480071 RepID=UPI0009852749|nr:phosphotransferase family protein [Virgibacillus siamensis]